MTHLMQWRLFPNYASFISALGHVKAVLPTAVGVGAERLIA
ncbi:MAG: hypothetical protein U1E12_01375 [Hydrogenophaga sp.]|jgi:hypothetical protein|nr:hypothetical protein [Hydrogenophaga sp.]MDZ4100308.1 hypothetical protein [Hydrogenophaga sp.]